MEPFAQLEAAVAGLATTIDLLEYREQQLEQERPEDDREVAAAGFLVASR